MYRSVSAARNSSGNADDKPVEAKSECMALRWELNETTESAASEPTSTMYGVWEAQSIRVVDGGALAKAERDEFGRLIVLTIHEYRLRR
jgi:hypothetical protein